MTTPAPERKPTRAEFRKQDLLALREAGLEGPLDRDDQDGRPPRRRRFLWLRYFVWRNPWFLRAAVCLVISLGIGLWFHAEAERVAASLARDRMDNPEARHSGFWFVPGDAVGVGVVMFCLLFALATGISALRRVIAQRRQAVVPGTAACAARRDGEQDPT